MIAAFQGLKVSVRIGIDSLGETKEYDKALARLDAWMKSLSSDAATATSRPVGETAAMLAVCKKSALGVLLMKKDYAELIKRASEYIKSDPDNIDLLKLRSSALNEALQPAKALEDMRKMHKLQPNEMEHWNNLGYQLADLGLELTESEKLIKRSLTYIGPSSANYVAPLDSLAWVLYKQGKLHDAGRMFLEVIKLSREHKYIHPILFDHAGDGFYRLGWTDKAVELWTKALKTAADDKTDAREVRLVKRKTPGKIKAAKAGKPVQVAPLGKGIKIQDK
jgi:tetratricopeptide (TPR) repeat protein